MSNNSFLTLSSREDDLRKQDQSFLVRGALICRSKERDHSISEILSIKVFDSRLSRNLRNKRSLLILRTDILLIDSILAVLFNIISSLLIVNIDNLLFIGILVDRITLDLHGSFLSMQLCNTRIHFVLKGQVSW